MKQICLDSGSRIGVRSKFLWIGRMYVLEFRTLLFNKIAEEYSSVCKTEMILSWGCTEIVSPKPANISFVEFGIFVCLMSAEQTNLCFHDIFFAMFAIHKDK